MRKCVLENVLRTAGYHPDDNVVVFVPGVGTFNVVTAEKNGGKIILGLSNTREVENGKK